MTKRILHVIHWLNRGGIETWLIHMLTAIDRSTYAMDICCKGPQSGEMAVNATALGATVMLCRLGYSPLAFAHKLRSVIRTRQYDLVHVHGGAAAGIVALVGALMNVPVLASFHNTNTELGVGRLPWMLRWVSDLNVRTACSKGVHYTGCSQAVVDAISKRLRVHQHRATASVLPYGIPRCGLPTQLERQAIRDELGFPVGAFVVVHVGHFKQQKNHAGVLRIFGAVRRAGIDAQLLLIGDGELMPSIQRAAKDAGLANAVTFMGSRSDVMRLLAAGDVFLFPSLWEGFGLVLVEAQMRGLPVVAYDHEAFTDLVLPGVTGFLHSVGDEAGMAGSVIKLSRDPHLRLKMRENAHQQANSRYSVESAALRLCTLYQGLLGE